MNLFHLRSHFISKLCNNRLYYSVVALSCIIVYNLVRKYNLYEFIVIPLYWKYRTYTVNTDYTRIGIQNRYWINHITFWALVLHLLNTRTSIVASINILISKKKNTIFFRICKLVWYGLLILSIVFYIKRRKKCTPKTPNILHFLNISCLLCIHNEYG